MIHSLQIEKTMTKTVCHIENTERAMDGESMAVSKYG